ncbi:hypothetical protein Lesp02_58630 [Lentzea sp. NBRC 105346]|nr:hypothetical protein [Lentzea sp. NBRC 105346]GLZ33675.1 hypothetical protein Lesp02_58630 [Lentzea sp. NBRC 105346]
MNPNEIPNETRPGVVKPHMETELTIFDVLSGDVTWEELDETRVVVE